MSCWDSAGSRGAGKPGGCSGTCRNLQGLRKHHVRSGLTRKTPQRFPQNLGALGSPCAPSSLGTEPVCCCGGPWHVPGGQQRWAGARAIPTHGPVPELPGDVAVAPVPASAAAVDSAEANGRWERSLMNSPIDFAGFELLYHTEQTHPPSFAQCKPMKGTFGIKGLSGSAVAPGILLNRVLLLLRASSREGFWIHFNPTAI